MNDRLLISQDQLNHFCHKWKITKLALFGSALREDFGPQSDLDLLVTFDTGAEWGLLDHVQMEQELEVLAKRRVELVTKRAIERSVNWIRRQEILELAQLVYESKPDQAPNCNT